VKAFATVSLIAIAGDFALRRDFWHMTPFVTSIHSRGVHSVFGKALKAVADLWPAISPADSDYLRKSRVAVRGGHLAIALLVIAAIVGTIIRGAKVFSVAETLGLVLLGLVFLGLSLWGLLLVERAVLAPGPSQEFQSTGAWKFRFYFILQLALVLLILRLAYPSRSLGTLWLILLVPISQSVMLLSRWGIFLVCSASTTIFTVTLVLFGWESVVEPVISFLFAVLFTLVFTQIAVSAETARGEVERLATQLSEANRKLREYAVEVEELATVRERNRLAREIHDSLGHYLTVVNVQIEAARAVMDRDRNRTLDALQKAQSLTHEGLQEIRRSVASLRSSPLDNASLSDVLRAAVLESQTNGIATEMQVLGEARSLSRQTELTLYRAAQEGITNVRKHAKAGHVSLVLDFRDAAKVKLCVKDDGVGAENATGGFGLLGLRERAQLLAGEVRVQTSPGNGFTLEVEVPG
jgi:signal transduction histidine kinase